MLLHKCYFSPSFFTFSFTSLLSKLLITFKIDCAISFISLSFIPLVVTEGVPHALGTHQGSPDPVAQVALDTHVTGAVIKIDADGLPTASFGNSDNLAAGDWVLALGNALALRGGPTMPAF